MILAGDIAAAQSATSLYSSKRAQTCGWYFKPAMPQGFPPLSICLTPSFRRRTLISEKRGRISITAAGFGIAGTVVGGRLYAINLPWQLEPASLASALNLNSENIVFMNDLVATAWGIDRLEPQDFFLLNEVTPQFQANKALIAAGTGLGEAMLFWDGHRHVAAPSEGGAAAFAPRTAREIHFLQYLKQDLARVSCEEVFSGRGFRKIHEFLNPAAHHPVFNESSGDSAREITQNAMSGVCEVCVETLISGLMRLAPETGNLVLRVLAYGGGTWQVSSFKNCQNSRRALSLPFSDKAPLNALLARVPIFVILNEDAPLLGAAYWALGTLGSCLHART
jgi:glucokinase